MFSNLFALSLFSGAALVLGLPREQATSSRHSIQDFLTNRQPGVTGLGLGQPCFHDSNCHSGLCMVGRCVCTKNWHCPPPFKCIKDTIPFCDSGKKEGGQPCSNGNECDSDNCIGGMCACFGTTVCPADKPCRGKSINAICYPINQPIGAACFAQDNCATSKCKFSECVCRYDSHCAPNETCVRPVFKKNSCEPKNLLAGFACQRNRQCKEGRCFSGKCRCTSDGACPGAQKCRKVFLGKNYCYEKNKKSSGEKCKRDDECKSGKCKRKFLKKKCT